MAANPLQAQFVYATTPDDMIADQWGNNIHRVQNTGNDVGEFNGRPLKVMTWDGTLPSLGWDWGPGGSIASLELQGYSWGGRISDPDVVVDPMGKGYTAVTYVMDLGSGPAIWAELWRFNGSSMTPVMSPVQIDDLSGNPASNPNIDIDNDGSGDGVITFEQDGKIYARAINIFNGPSGNLFDVSGRCLSGGKSFHPDVATFYDKNRGNTIVSFTYVFDDGSDKILILQQEELSDIMNNPAASCNILKVIDKTPSFNLLQMPRIAAPSPNVSSDPYDVQVVAHLKDLFDRIKGYNKNMAAHGSGNVVTTILNSTSRLDNCNHGAPAVTYVDRSIIVGWTTMDVTCRLINGDDEILVRQLHDDGTPQYGIYAVANQNMGGNQFAVSVAGRYDLNLETFYTFYNDKDKFIIYKSSHNQNQAIRKGNVAETANTPAGLTVYPSPLQEKATINFTIGKDETAVALELYSLNGRKVRTYDVQGKTSGTHSLALNRSAEGSALASGIYLLRLNTSKTSQAIRVVISN